MRGTIDGNLNEQTSLPNHSHWANAYALLLAWQVVGRRGACDGRQFDCVDGVPQTQIPCGSTQILDEREIRQNLRILEPRLRPVIGKPSKNLGRRLFYITIQRILCKIVILVRVRTDAVSVEIRPRGRALD